MTTTRSAPPAGVVPATTNAYRPELQGLRALSAALVVCYHVWFDRVSGGVDVFLIVTGFLLTGQLYRAAARGKFSLPQRWSRTLVRLLPSMAVVLVTTAVAGFLILPEGRWHQTVREIVASVLFLENWQLAADSVDYAARSNTTSVVQHFWSLSIQGQVFLFWPIVIALVVLAARRVTASLHTCLTITSAVVFVASLAYSVSLTITDQPLAYFHSLTRAWEFALGALLALWIDRIMLPMWARIAMGWVGVVALVACGLVIEGVNVFPGYAALWPTGCAVLVLLAGHTRSAFAADRILAGRWARYLGDLSFTLYLWHWPVLMLYLSGRDHYTVGLLGGLAIIAVSMVLSVLTHHLVEKPLIARGFGVRGGVKLAAVCAAVVLLAAAAWQGAASVRAMPSGVVGDAQHPGSMALTTGPVKAAPLLPTAVSVLDDWDNETDWNCSPVQTFPTSNVCVQPVQNPARRVVIVGDSHIQQFGAALRPIAEKYHWQLISLLRGACPFSTASETDPNQPGCVEWNNAAVQEIADLKPDAVVTLASLDVMPGLTEHTPPGFPAQWKRVTDLGIPVLAVRDNPRFTFSMPDCVQQNGIDSPRCSFPRADIYSAVPPYEKVPGVPPGVTFLDTADAICTATVCPPTMGNVLVYLDDNHLTRSYTTTMAGVIEEQVVKAVDR
ncbi:MULTISPECIES: acyltransferase family protein [unclassified Pseudonocardia]|uniref:acyltransferase family protein n=1 Tax=unclassified Pseudonocardia TaxID=2619320 RepID=UPI00095FF614|nr:MULTISPECIES: acyltransferase family protein [unclassified Pseudonocardia]MBN9099720.1 acyltransferase [Pseudonocardia sp.]OJY45218.1 MAG: acyltransferase [Pseudonocardia sp. 73-21]